MERHRFDSVSFVFGLIFLGLALVFGLPETPWDFFSSGVLGLVVPAIVIAVGLALLAPSFRREQPVGHPGEAPPLVEPVDAAGLEAERAAHQELPPTPLP
jgi:hypothetical protein